MRLIVRRVKPTPGSQLALFVNYSYHAFITDRAGELGAGGRPSPSRRDRNAIRDLKYGVGLNHLPSGRFAANGAWLAVQVIAHNLARWTARLGLGEIVTTRTLRRRYFALAGRLTHSARRWTPRKRCPGLASGQPRWRGYGRYRSRPDARSQRRPGSEARASMPAHASRTLAPAPSAPPSRAERRWRRLLAPANADAPAELSGTRQPAPSSFDRWIRGKGYDLEYQRDMGPTHRW